MARDLTVSLENRPGALADMGDALGRAGVNIDGISGTAGSGEVHILVEDAAAAKAALSDAGIQVGAENDVVKVGFEDRPGELGEIGRRVADAGANIEVVYISCDGQLVLATSDNAAVESSA
ncbi:MAG TPA: ACT domain-containing protein [Acidimicrobiia bacterium]|nr:ACT domain-containing protein [Acidimicrobiia bacterium]